VGVEENWSGLSDDELLHAARKQPEAFAAFYRRHERPVLAFFLSRAADAEVAADLAAETFAAALSSVGRFRPRPTPPAAWLFGIARNTLAMSRRQGRVEDRARRRLGMDRLELTDDVIKGIEALAGTAVDLVDELPPAQREAVRARVVDGRDYGEIARDLRCSEAVVRKRVSRGLSTVRERLEQQQ
jgi:RNA polymerase sigma factor (sigma-70 family)